MLANVIEYKSYTELKSSRNKKDLNDVTAALFSVSFSQLPAAKKHTENRAAVTSLRSFLFRDDFNTYVVAKSICTYSLCVVVHTYPFIIHKE